MSLRDANRNLNNQRSVHPATPLRNESPLKPLADLMNNRSQAYQQEMQNKKKRNSGSSPQKQHSDSFQKKKVLISTVTTIDEQQEGNFKESRSANRNDQRQQQQYSIRREKSVENITISQMRRSKSWDHNQKK